MYVLLVQMKRKSSIGEMTTAYKKMRISRKGASGLNRISMKDKTGRRLKPSYGVTRSLNYSLGKRDLAAGFKKF